MRTILLTALSQNHFELVFSLLKKMPLYLLKETEEDGKNIAHELAEHGMLEELQYLANNPLTKPLLTALDNKGCTPFIIAVLNNQQHIVNYFIDNQHDNFSSKAHKAAFLGQLEELKALNKNDWNVRDTFNINPAGYSIAAGQTEVLKFLAENTTLLMPLNYPNLFIRALDLQHEETALFLLTKIDHTNFINKISSLIKILAKNPATSIETLSKIELTIKPIIPDQYKANYYSCFMASAVVYNDLTIFAHFIQKFLKEKFYLFSTTTLKDICVLISKHKQFQFTCVLANELFLSTEPPILTAACCYHFIEKDDDISLDIFLGIVKEFNESFLYYLKNNIFFNLFNCALQKQTPAIIVTLRRYFTEEYFIENKNFFTLEEDFEFFLKVYSPTGNYQYISDTPEHNEFTKAVNYILSLPENPIEYYEIVSENLRLCSQMTLAHTDLFAQKTINLLHEIIDSYTLAKKPNWLLFQRIFSDIKYLVLEADLPIEIIDLSNLLKLSFIFSDYQTADEILNKFFSNQETDDQKLFILHKITFLVAKICALLLSETNFHLSDDIKNLLLQEHKSSASISSDFISDISLLMLLPNTQLTLETSQKLCQKIGEITPGKIRDYIATIIATIQPFMLSPEITHVFFQSLQILYDTLYQLKEWTDNITIERETFYPAYQTDQNALQKQLMMFSTYENRCHIKIFIFEAILELINLLESSRKNARIILSEDVKNFSPRKELKNLFSKINTSEIRKSTEKKDWNCKTFYEDSLTQAQADLRQLSAAYLITQDQLEKLTKKSISHKTQKLLKKPEKSHKSALKITKPPVLVAKPIIKTYPSPRVIPNENDPKISSQQARGGNKKNPSYKKSFPQAPIKHAIHNKKTVPQSSLRKAANLSIPASPKKSGRAGIPIQLQNTRLEQDEKPSRLKFNKNHHLRNWEALKKYLSNSQNSPKIIENRLLDEWGFSINIPEKVREFFTHFQKNELFLVGGALRNLLTRKRPKDFDFVARSSAEKIKKRFPHCKEKGNGKKTILTLSYGNYEFDILPIECSSYLEALELDNEKILRFLLLDAQQRDFTINALYWTPEGLIDVCGGIADLLFHRILKPIQSESEHFEVQNAVRILRGIRFAVQFHLTISEDLRHTMLSNACFLYTVHTDRIQAEYKSLRNAIGEIQAIQLYQHYFLYDLVSIRILNLPALSWENFWSTSPESSVRIKRNQELAPIGEHIRSYLSEEDLCTLKCMSKNPFTFFQPAEMQNEKITRMDKTNKGLSK